MFYYSTEDKKHTVSLKEAVLHGMPKKGGLYLPMHIPQVPESFFKKINGLNFREISLTLAKLLLNDDVPDAVLDNIVNDALYFDTPLVAVNHQIKTLELFHGPTLAFKDVGARFMARLMSYFISGSNKKLNIVVATSGDTGSAVAHGFFKIPGINVFVLYPSEKISEIQEKQIATLGENITCMEIKGSFDDCQTLVKQVLWDTDFTEEYDITTANSINIARLLPQIFYYFRLYSQLKKEPQYLTVSVPSGNFGNLTAGLMAKRMGLPVYKFIASTNVNDVVPKYLKTGVFRSQPSQSTISNAMDVGDPSNFVRIFELYQGDLNKLRHDLYGAGFNDQQTRECMRNIFNKYGYICDPHGAVGYLGLKDYLKTDAQIDTAVFLETAHPAKFKNIVEPEISTEVKIPDRLERYLKKEKKTIRINRSIERVKDLIAERN
ncbi:MAG: threonine synthase [bacterium]